MHDIESVEHRKDACKHRGNNCKIFGDVIRNREGGKGAAGHQQLLADCNDLDELCGVGVEINHVAGLFGGLSAGVHRDTDVSLSECGCVVGAIAGHRDELALRLLALDQVHLVFGLRFSEEVIDAGFAGDSGRCERVVTGNHDGANAHSTKMVEPLPHAAFHNIFEVNYAEGTVVFGD